MGDDAGRDGLAGLRRRADEVRADPRVRRLRTSGTEILFGDRTGQTLFLAAVAFFVLTWRVGTFFNDITLFVPALERLANGHLSLGIPSEIERGYPGMYYDGGYVYARNYGQLALSLPAYWVVGAFGPTVFRALVVLGWGGLLVVLGARVGAHFDRRRTGLRVGGALAALSVIASAATFEGFSTGQMNVAGSVEAAVALQVTTMFAAAFTAVLVYRALARSHETGVGVAAGAVTAFASPVGFWATLPKRHAFTALFVVLSLYALVRVRDAERERSGDDPAADSGDLSARLGPAGFRGVAYASAGILAWIHAPEGFTLFLAVALVDLPTLVRARRRTRTVAVVVGALFASLVPFLLTNYLISGDPLEPPRFLRSVGNLDSLADPPDSTTDGGGGADGGAGDGGGGTDGGGGSSSDGEGGGSSGGGGESDGGLVPDDADGPPDRSTDSVFGIDPETLVPERFMTLLEIGLLRYIAGIELMIEEFDRLTTVFVRWGERGRTPGNVNFDAGTDLSVLESLPLAAAAAVAPLAQGIRTARERVGPREWGLDRVDAFVVVFSVLQLALYIERLPLHVMLTVRYLHPLYPLLIYAVFRQAPIRATLTRRRDYALWGYQAAVLLGTPVALGAILLDDGFLPPPPGEIVQPFALVALATAAAVAASTVATAIDDRFDRAAALALGLAAGVATTYILVTAFFVFHFGESALPVVEAAAQAFENAVFP